VGGRRATNAGALQRATRTGWSGDDRVHQDRGLSNAFDIDRGTKAGAAQGAKLTQMSVPATNVDSARVYLWSLLYRVDPAS
jgi:hypothetical protein